MRCTPVAAEVGGCLTYSFSSYRNAEGKLTCKFGALIHDDRCSNIFEALVGPLRAAKKKKILTFEGQMLLSPAHDDVDIICL